MKPLQRFCFKAIAKSNSALVDVHLLLRNSFHTPNFPLSCKNGLSKGQLPMAQGRDFLKWFSEFSLYSYFRFNENLSNLCPFCFASCWVHRIQATLICCLLHISTITVSFGTKDSRTRAELPRPEARNFNWKYSLQQTNPLDLFLTWWTLEACAWAYLSWTLPNSSLLATIFDQVSKDTQTWDRNIIDLDF